MNTKRSPLEGGQGQVEEVRTLSRQRVDVVKVAIGTLLVLAVIEILLRIGGQR